MIQKKIMKKKLSKRNKLVLILKIKCLMKIIMKKIILNTNNKKIMKLIMMIKKNILYLIIKLIKQL
jgi:hypothetical protein